MTARGTFVHAELYDAVDSHTQKELDHWAPWVLAPKPPRWQFRAYRQWRNGMEWGWYMIHRAVSRAQYNRGGPPTLLPGY